MLETVILRTLRGTTTQGLSGTGSNGNDEVLHIPQSSRTGASPSGSVISRKPIGMCLCVCICVCVCMYVCGRSYPSAEIQLAYSTASVDLASYYSVHKKIRIPVAHSAGAVEHTDRVSAEG